MTNNKFYFEGKSFEDEDEFWNYSNEWRSLPLKIETAEKKMDLLKKDIIFNLFMTDTNLTNNDFSNVLVSTFEFMIREIHAKQAERQVYPVEETQKG